MKKPKPNINNIDDIDDANDSLDKVFRSGEDVPESR